MSSPAETPSGGTVPVPGPAAGDQLRIKCDWTRRLVAAGTELYLEKLDTGAAPEIVTVYLNSLRGFVKEWRAAQTALDVYYADRYGNGTP